MNFDVPVFVDLSNGNFCRPVGRGLTMKKMPRYELMLSLSYNNSYGNAPWLSAGTLNRDDFSKVRVHRTGSNY